MGSEMNKALVRRVFAEGANQQRLEVFDELLSPSYVNHNMPAPKPGPEGFKQVMGMFFAAFPDIQIQLDDVIAAGDRVATRGRMRGTHRGDFMGIPATGKRVDVGYIDIWRIENGKAIENWVQLDLLGMMQQLGAVPAAGQAPA